MTTTVYYVDFKSKTLLDKKEIDSEEVVVLDQITLGKHFYFSGLINTGMTTIKVNTRYPGVKLPQQIKESHLVTSVNWSAKFNIPDFKFDNSGVRGTLSFDGQNYFTDLPWGSVWGISLSDGQQNKEWKESIPKEIYFDSEKSDT